MEASFTKEMLNSITLLGSSSGRNAGDAALLAGIMDSIDDACGTQLLYEIPTISPAFIRRQYTNRTRPIATLPWNLSIKMLGLPTYRSIRRTDLSLVFDAVLFDRALLNPLFNFLSTFHLLVPRSKRPGKTLGFFNVGVGPVTSRLGKRMLRELAERVDFITVRDQESLDILGELGVSNPRVLLTADTALNAGRVGHERVDEILEEIGLRGSDEVLAVNVNRYLDRWAGEGQPALDLEGFLNAYTHALTDVARTTGCSILFVSTQHHDAAITRELMRRVGTAMPTAIMTNIDYDHEEITGVLARVSMLFSMRLHALILCSSSETPITGLAYQPKVSYYFNHLGLGEYCIGFDGFSAGRLVEHLLHGWNHRREIREQLAQRIPVMKVEALKAPKLVASIHRGEDLDRAFAGITGATP